jgi:hypothetical protein
LRALARARRATLVTWWLVAALVRTHASGAQEVTVPLAVQAALVAKIAPYDKNFAARAGGVVRIAIVLAPDNADSVRFAAQLRAALAQIDTIGGLPHEDDYVEFRGAAALAETCRARGLSIVYFGPGLEGDIASVRAGIDGLSILSVAATADYVPRGIVLGFALEGARTKLLLNIAQARRQQVALNPDVVRLMKVYE